MEKSGQIRIKKLIQVFRKAATEVDVNYIKKKNLQGRQDYQIEDVSLLQSSEKTVIYQRQRSHLNLDAGMCRTYIQQLQPPDGRLCLLVKSALVSGHQLAETAVDKLHHLRITKHSITPVFWYKYNPSFGFLLKRKKRPNPCQYYAASINILRCRPRRKVYFY